MDLWVICALLNSDVSEITPVRSKNGIITDAVFLSTLQLTALLWPKFRLRLHCYTLAFTSRGFTPKNLILMQKLIIQRGIGWRWSFWGNQTQFILNKGRKRFGYMHINTFWSIFFVISGSNTVAQFHVRPRSKQSWLIACKAVNQNLLEPGCYTSGLALNAPLLLTIGGEGLSIYL